MNRHSTMLFALFFVLALIWLATGRFSSSSVASSDVTVRDSAPTVNDDIDRGFLPGYVWVDQTGAAVYVLVDAADGAADWDQVN